MIDRESDLIQEIDSGANKEVEVLEEPQDSQIGNQREPKPFLFTRLMDFFPGIKIDKGRNQYQGKKTVVPATVKEIREAKQQGILGLERSAQVPIGNDGQQQERRKLIRIKSHL